MHLFHSEDWTLGKWAIAGPHPSNPAMRVSTVRKYSSIIYVVGRMWIKKTTKLVSCIQELDSYSGDENTNRWSLRGPWRSLNLLMRRTVGVEAREMAWQVKDLHRIMNTRVWVPDTHVNVELNATTMLRRQRRVSKAHLTTTFAQIHANMHMHMETYHTHTHAKETSDYIKQCAKAGRAW